MSTDVALSRGDVVLAPRPASIPETMAEKVEYARLLAESGLLPPNYRKNPANILFAIEYGAMLGLSPIGAIVGVWVIDGKPTASAALISALVRQAGHKLRTTGDEKRAVTEIVRRDDPGFTFRVEWTLDRARNAGLLSKDIWKKYGQNMLKHRTVSECANDACQEVIFGLLTPEELGADVDKEGNLVGGSTVEATRSVDEPSAETPAPDFDAMIRDAEIAQDADKLRQIWDMAKGMFPHDRDLLEKIAAAAEQVKARKHPVQVARVKAEHRSEDAPDKKRGRLHALLREGAVSGSDRAARLRIVNRILNRPPTQPATSFDDLSPAEMDTVSDFLQRRKDEGDLIHTLADLGAETPPADPQEVDGRQGELWAPENAESNS